MAVAIKGTSAVRRVETASFSGEYDVFRKEEIALALAPLRDADVAIVDCTETTYADSTFLNALAKLHTHMGTHSGEVRLVGPNPHMTRILALVGFDKFFTIYPTAAEAKN